MPRALIKGPITTLIVARSGRKGNEEKFSLAARAPLEFSRQHMSHRPTRRHPWAWIPTLYVAEGLPNALALSVSLVLYKNLGVSNADITFFTAWLYLPWVIKPLWSPAVDILKTRRLWIWTMQLAFAAALAGVALAIPSAHFFQTTLVLFWLLAFASATHDVAADGFYLLALAEREQSFFSGVRNTFYRVAGILAKGQLVILAGILAAGTARFARAWAIVFGIVAGIVLLLALYHRIILPHPVKDRAGARERSFSGNFFETFTAFFRKPGIGMALLFLLTYRFGEAQLLPMTQLFFLDPRSAGGLELTNTQVGFLYNTVGVTALICGGLLGGFVISRRGLKFWLWPMLLAIHLPDAMFIWLAATQPGNLFAIGAAVVVEQFGYGFGFASYMLYMIYLARGAHATAHYAICTGFMALGLMVPGLWSGWLQAHLGYKLFFSWVILATVPSFVVAFRVSVEKDFGKHAAEPLEKELL
jgi:MFS transporter, PAT family, beta-lactamase induction signal transducer AmpG